MFQMSKKLKQCRLLSYCPRNLEKIFKFDDYSRIQVSHHHTCVTVSKLLNLHFIEIFKKVPH